MIIKHAYIEKFRGLKEIDFDLGKKLTVIVGHNGTMKTTVLGILGQPFTLEDKAHPMHGEKTLDNYDFKSQFSEKFKLSDKDKAGEHKWRLDLYPGIHKNDCFEIHSIDAYRKNNPNAIRFWSTEGKNKGTGYIQAPVYFLSLKRCSPIGEEKNIDILDILTDDEKNFLIKENKEIFTTFKDRDLDINEISSKNNKFTAAIHDKNHDATSISAGQDNIGKILLAVLSFKRLKDKFPKDYKGGILLIDEVESTFHPSAQQRLIKRMLKYSKDYNIQFIVTTHSPAVVKSAFFDKYNSKDISLLYLKKVSDTIKQLDDFNIENIVCELNGEVKPKKAGPKKTKINIFCEDLVAKKIIQNLLKLYKSRISISNCSLGAEEYLELTRVKLSEIVNSLIILDGDKNPNENRKIKSKLEKLNKNNLGKNILFLPSDFLPEKMFYRFLYETEEESEFWDINPGGYDKQKCFKNYPSLYNTDSANEFKKWFDEEKKYWGKDYEKLLNFWKITKVEEYDSFLDKFKKAFNTLALKLDIECIDE